MRKRAERPAMPKKGRKTSGIFSSKGRQKLDKVSRSKKHMGVLAYAKGTMQRSRDIKAKA